MFAGTGTAELYCRADHRPECTVGSLELLCRWMRTRDDGWMKVAITSVPERGDRGRVFVRNPLNCADHLRNLLARYRYVVQKGAAHPLKRRVGKLPSLHEQ